MGREGEEFVEMVLDLGVVKAGEKAAEELRVGELVHGGLDLGEEFGFFVGI